MTGASIDEAFAFHALRDAALRAARGHRRAHDAAEFLCDLERNVLALARAVLDGTWEPGPSRHFLIREPKERIVSAVPFSDRVVHHAIIRALEPRWERIAVGCSFACRRGRGVHKAIGRVRGLAKEWPYFLKLDIRHFFETVDHECLRILLDRTVTDPGLRALLGRVVAAGAGSPGRGLPIGSLTSQHMANLVLGQVDRFALRTLRVGGWVRFMDDMLAFGDDLATVWGWHDALAQFVTGRLRQSLKAEATRIGPVASGIAFLGFRVWPGATRLDGPRRRRCLRTLRGHRKLIQAGADPAWVQRRSAAVLGHIAHAATRGLVASTAPR